MPQIQWSRALGLNETAYYLPSRHDGVNDMYNRHTVLTEQTELFTESRMLLIWALILLKHPLMASVVDEKSYRDISFVYTEPQTRAEALARAAELFILTEHDVEDIAPIFLDGGRILSNTQLSRLWINKEQSLDNPKAWNFSVSLLKTHFIGDSASVQVITNEVLTGLAMTAWTEDVLKFMIDKFLAKRKTNLVSPIPPAADAFMRYPKSFGRLARTVGKVDFYSQQQKLVGGQSFPVSTADNSSNPKSTFTSTFVFSEEQTKAIIKAGKEKGVTVGHMFFAACNLAWARIGKGSAENPCLMYSAMNLRPALGLATNFNDWSYLCLGYFNIALPAFIPSTISPLNTFWSRCQMAKSQVNKLTKSPFVVSRTAEICKIRAQKAIQWAIIDDAAAQAMVSARRGSADSGVELISEKGTKSGASTPTSSVTNPPSPAMSAKPVPPPQNALMGVSMLGNVDLVFTAYDLPDVPFKTNGTSMGVRQREAGVLLFNWTFRKQLSYILQFDNNHFDSQTMMAFKTEVQNVLEEIKGVL